MGRQKSMNGKGRKKVWKEWRAAGVEIGRQAREILAVQGLVETKGGPVPRYQDCSAQGSWEAVVSGKFEGQLAPYPPHPLPPPPLVSVGCTTFQTFATSPNIHVCAFSDITSD